MPHVKVHEHIPKRALITRDSARLIKQAINEQLADQPHELTVDFAGIEAVTPSFVDELITVLGEVDALRRTGSRIVFQNLPTRLSEKFHAIGRGHGLRMVESAGDTWTITESTSAA